MTSCTLTGCQGGFSAGEGSLLEDCVADTNASSSAFAAGAGSSLVRCRLRSHTGLYGIFTPDGSGTISACTVVNSTVHTGILAGAGSVVRDCVVDGCTSSDATPRGAFAGGSIR